MSIHIKLNERSSDRRTAFLAVLLAATIGIATLGMPVVAAGASATAGPSNNDADATSAVTALQDDDETDPADEIYLREDGSAVLVYEDDGDVSQLELGMDVSEGLFHMLVVDDVEDPDDEFEEGSFSAVLDEDGFTSTGAFVMQQPDDLAAFDLDASGEVTDETNRFDVSASGTFGDEGGTAAPGSVHSDGHVMATADRFETSGSVSADIGAGMAVDDEGAEFDVTLEDANDGYVLDVTRKENVGNWGASNWETREQAVETLEAEYGTLATELGGASEITISHYDFEERGDDHRHDRLELAFTVEYTGIDEGIEQQFTDELVTDPATDLSRDEAAEIAESITELEIETAAFTMEEADGSVDIDWDVALANYDELTSAMIELGELSAADDELAETEIEEAKAALEAQQATDLTWELQWETSITQSSAQELEFEADVTSETDNWAAYVDELESSDVDVPTGLTFSLTGDTDGDELALEGEFDLAAEDAIDEAIEWTQSAQDETTTASADTDEFLSALANSDIEVARIDVDIDESTVRVEGGAKFDDMSELSSVFSDTAPIQGIATEDDTMYVYVTDLGEDVDPEVATAADLDHLDVVDSDTTVHQAGEWDEEFPEPDTAEMSEYLGVEQSDDGAESDDSDGLPGFGLGAGLAALLLVTTLAVRRRT